MMVGGGIVQSGSYFSDWMNHLEIKPFDQGTKVMVKSHNSFAKLCPTKVANLYTNIEVNQKHVVWVQKKLITSV